MPSAPHPEESTAPVGPHWDRTRLVPTRRQLLLTVTLAVLAAITINPIVLNPFVEVLGETLFVGMALLFCFTVAGAWRQTLLPRWVAQVLAVAVGAALSPLGVQMLSAHGDFSAFIGSRDNVRGYMLVTFMAAIVGSLFALGALYRERDAQARSEALRFALERETLQRQAADARLHLMTAQIEPHFLLNTLANVQQLVESGSPQAVPVFRSLIAYLRAAMPQLQQRGASGATLGDEERLVRAYLALMLMRMPDRLAFTVEIEPALRALAFPQMGLLTLVENAIRHGIDPGEGGGRIEVGARRDGADLMLWVADTGVGLSEGIGTGMGLRNLQERLLAAFGPAAKLTLAGQPPQGVRAEIRTPMPAP